MESRPGLEALRQRHMMLACFLAHWQWQAGREMRALWTATWLATAAAALGLWRWR